MTYSTIASTSVSTLSAEKDRWRFTGRKSPDEYFALSRVDTVEEARTGLFVPEWKRLYVVARNRPPLFPAELMSFAILEDQEH